MVEKEVSDFSCGLIVSSNRDILLTGNIYQSNKVWQGIALRKTLC